HPAPDPLPLPDALPIYAPAHDRPRRPAARERGGGVHVLLLVEAERRDVASALPVMPQVEQERVPAQAMDERDLAHHLDAQGPVRSEEHTSELQSRSDLV